MVIVMRVWWVGVLLMPWIVGAESPMDEAALWKKIQIPNDFVEKFITNEKCDSSPDYRKSCLAALNAAGNFAKKTVQFTDHPQLDFAKSLQQILRSQKPSKRSQILAAALNAHMQYFDPYAEFNTSLHFMEQFEKNEEIGGIGVDLEIYDGRVRIQSVIPNSPAQKAGLQSGDVIIAAKDAKGSPLKMDSVQSEDFFDHLGGPIDSIFDMIVDRNGEQIAFQIKRQQVEIENVVSQIIGDVGYVRIRNFAVTSTCGDIKTELAKLHREGIKGLVLDLRDNGGGQVRVGVCVAGLFAGPKPIVKIVKLEAMIKGLESITGGVLTEEESNDGWLVPGQKVVTQLPLIILIDGDSASAAELVAGALRDHERAWLVGDRSYGKGTNQRREPLDFFVENLWVSQTTAFFLLPSKQPVQGIGLQPDFTVPSQPGDDLSKYVKERETSTLKFDGVLPPAMPSRAQSRQDLEVCVKRHGDGLSQYKTLQAMGRPDYPLAYASALLECEISKESAVLRH